MDQNFLEDYYNSYEEESRLSSRYGNVEYATNMKYIFDHVGKHGKILDVGAGTGRYSISLARKGYFVNAIELVEHNIDIFRSKLTENDNIVVEQGNALDLSRFQNESFDAVLLLGPMYHLYREEDKVKALNEAKRVIKKGGCLFVAYCMNEATIIQFAFGKDGSNMLDCIQKNMLTEDFKCISKPKDLFEMVRMEDIERLNRVCGLKRVKIVASDLFSHYMKDRMDLWSDEVYDLYLKYHFTVCERGDLIGISNHVMDILVKQDSYRE